MTHTGHLCNASSIVTDGTICINSQTSGDGAKHSKGSNCNTIHSCKAEANKDADCYGKNRNDDRFVTQSKAKNNIGSSSSAAGISNILYGAVSIASIVLCDKPNNKTSPQANTNADEQLPALYYFLSTKVENCEG
nr:inorganic pyrophosphatase [Ipomoea batatas]